MPLTSLLLPLTRTRLQYIDNVINNNGTKYHDAYFEISSIKVFTVNNTVFTPTVTDGTTVLSSATATPDAQSDASGSSSGNGTSANGTSTGGSGGNGALPAGAAAYAAMVGATALAAFSWVLL